MGSPCLSINLYIVLKSTLFHHMFQLSRNRRSFSMQQAANLLPTALCLLIMDFSKVSPAASRSYQMTLTLSTSIAGDIYAYSDSLTCRVRVPRSSCLVRLLLRLIKLADRNRLEPRLLGRTSVYVLQDAGIKGLPLPSVAARVDGVQVSFDSAASFRSILLSPSQILALQQEGKSNKLIWMKAIVTGLGLDWYLGRGLP